MTRPARTATRRHGKHVVVVGAGGNIGSHLVPHLGREPAIGRVTLIDCDAYERKNLTSQDIVPSDVGKPKARVQARRLRRIRPDLAVEAIVALVGDVPLGRLRSDVVLAALDSRRARRQVNEAAWRLGVPWIDAGVLADGLLARVNVYVPGPDAPCLECAWDQRDYDAQDQRYPCQKGQTGEPSAPPTNAPSSLGALAASLQMLECAKLLDGRADQSLAGRQVVVTAATHQHYVTAFRRISACRFDHAVWRIHKLRRRAADLTLGQALALGRRGRRAVLKVPGEPIVLNLTCMKCGRARRLFRLSRRLTARQLTCPKNGCKGEMVATADDLREGADPARTPARMLRRSVRGLGLRDGDVFAVCGADGAAHYEIDMR